MTTHKHAVRTFDPALMGQAVIDSMKRMTPMAQWRNPVMFVTWLGAFLTTVLAIVDRDGFTAAISVWLWFTVLFANFAEALAEGRGKAQAASLRGAKQDTVAIKLEGTRRGAPHTTVNSSQLRKGDVVLVDAGQLLPGDGDVIDGVASVDESAITGESAPVVRAAGGDRSSVTGGTRVLSDWLVVRISANPGDSFLDRMIAMVEGAKRQRTPNEIALAILLAALTLVFLVAVATLLPYSIYSVASSGQGQVIGLTVLVALLVCLIPTTIGGLLSAIGIAGMDRMIQANVVRDLRPRDRGGRRRRRAAARQDRDDHARQSPGREVRPAPGGVSERELADAAQLASLADETPEGRSIVVLAKNFGIRGRELHEMNATFVPFTAQTRMSGIDIGERRIRKGAPDAIEVWLKAQGTVLDRQLRTHIDQVASKGATPLVVAEGARALGVIELRDIVKGGIKERFAQLRRMGIKTVMVTGDNRLTAAAIAAESGVDDFLAEATPEAKLKLIREQQAQGRLVAMCGDGTNDAPALAQADVAVAMNSGTQAAKEAGNMVDLDSNPTKLIEVVEIGKQMLITRGALTTFSIANDVAKYFAIIPAAFAATYPQLNALNVMGLASPNSAILSAVIFNALIIVALIPLALRGIATRADTAAALLRRNLLIYGLGGLIVPFIGIKAVDLFLVGVGLV